MNEIRKSEEEQSLKKEVAKEIVYRQSIFLPETIFERMLMKEYTQEQKDEALLALKSGIVEEEVLKFFIPEISAAKMREMREKLILVNKIYPDETDYKED